jgi:hypothetical protein
VPHASLNPPALREPGRVSRAAELLRLIVTPQRRVDARLGAAQARRAARQYRVETAQRRLAAAQAQSELIGRVVRAFEDVCADLDTELNQKLAEIAADPTRDIASRTEAADVAVAEAERRRALARNAAVGHLEGVS